MSSRDEILSNWNIDQDGIIREPGKFQGEMLYVPHFWYLALDGGSDQNLWDDDIRIEVFIIRESDRKMFPELGDIKILWLFETDSGFVEAIDFDTEAAALKAEKDLETNDDDRLLEVLSSECVGDPRLN